MLPRLFLLNFLNNAREIGPTIVSKPQPVNASVNQLLCRYWDRKLEISTLPDTSCGIDEPFSSVDEQTRRKFQEELLELLRHKQKTVIFVTHSIEEAAYLSDQIVLLSPRPGTVSKIIRPNIKRGVRDPDEIRRDKNYLDVVEEIWQILKRYV